MSSIRSIVFRCAPLSLLFFGMVACSENETTTRNERPPAPVEVSPVEAGSIRGQRVFSGTLEASATFTIAPEVGGRIDQIQFDLGDRVPRGAVVARLDDAELKQAVARAEADLMVARANFVESESSLTLTRRSIARSETLRERGVASEAELDTARSELLAQEARVEVFRAEIARAEAALEAARIQLSHTVLEARWQGPGDTRQVARRYADAGQNISAGADLLEIVAIAPITAVFFATERDYPNLRVDQPVQLRTDAFPGRIFTGQISRIAPVFDTSSRQARIEVRIDNDDEALKPGMFVRAEVEVARADNATIVPYASVERRSDETGVFLVSDDGTKAVWHTVDTGIRDGDRVQVIGLEPKGRVITIGQQLVEDGARISIITDDSANNTTTTEGAGA